MKLKIVELPKSCEKCIFYSEAVRCMGNNDYWNISDCKLKYFNYNDKILKEIVHAKCKLEIDKIIEI